MSVQLGRLNLLIYQKRWSRGDIRIIHVHTHLCISTCTAMVVAVATLGSPSDLKQTWVA